MHERLPLLEADDGKLTIEHHGVAREILTTSTTCA